MRKYSIVNTKRKIPIKSKRFWCNKAKEDGEKYHKEVSFNQFQYVRPKKVEKAAQPDIYQTMSRSRHATKPLHVSQKDFITCI